MRTFLTLLFSLPIAACDPPHCTGIGFGDLRNLGRETVVKNREGNPIALAAPGADVPELTGIDVRLWRYDSSPAWSCPEMATVEIHFHGKSPDTKWAGYGARMKLVRGELPFPVPDHPIAVGGRGGIGTHWLERVDAGRPALQAEIAVFIVNRDGKSGPVRYFEIRDDERPPAYVWPAWVRNGISRSRFYLWEAPMVLDHYFGRE